MDENFIGRIEQGRIGGGMCAERLTAICARLDVGDPADIGLAAERRHPTRSGPTIARRSGRAAHEIDPPGTAFDAESPADSPPTMLRLADNDETAALPEPDGPEPTGAANTRKANTWLFDARRRTPSPSPLRPGKCMTRRELADAVNTALVELFPEHKGIAAFSVDERWIGNLEQGKHHWGNEKRRAALRFVLGVETDAEIGLYPHRKKIHDLPLLVDDTADSDNLDPQTLGGRFGPDLRAARIAAGLSLEALARKAAVSKSYIGHIELGNRICTFEIAQILDNVLNMRGALAERANIDRMARIQAGGNPADVSHVDSAEASADAEIGLYPPLKKDLDLPLLTDGEAASGEDEPVPSGVASDGAVNEIVRQEWPVLSDSEGRSETDAASTVPDRAFGEALRHLREARGYSVRELAKIAYCSKSQISAIENGGRVQPDAAKRLDECLGAEGSLIAIAERASRVGAVNRRHFLVGVAATAIPLDGWLVRSSLSYADVEAIETITSTFREFDNRFGGVHAHPLVSQYLDTNVASMIHVGKYSDDIGVALFGAASRLANLAAWTAYDTDDHARVDKYLMKALEFATAAGDHAFSGEILAARAHHAIHIGAPVRARELARASQQVSKASAVPALQSEALIVEAIGSALVGDKAASVSAIVEAERVFEQATRDDLPGWLGYFDDAYLSARIAHCFRDLEDWSNATEFASRAVTMGGERKRTRAFNTTMLASALIETDLDRSVAVGTEALKLATDLQSARAVQYLNDYRRRLARRYEDHQIVKEFNERAEESLGD